MPILIVPNWLVAQEQRLPHLEGAIGVHRAKERERVALEDALQVLLVGQELAFLGREAVRDGDAVVVVIAA